MSKLKKPVTLETPFGGEYVIDEILGEGGAGRVYGGSSADKTPVAVKVLTSANSDKRRRFKNEASFLSQNKHANIVTVIDHGLATDKEIAGPFYVMRRYECNLRDQMHKGVEPTNVLQLFAKILDGVEAAHLQGVVHRDLKPENILCDDAAQTVAVADFGVASFTEETLLTLVETSPAQRLANFVYAAPEQRARGRVVGVPADIYALGLMLNELFTGEVPHGTEYKAIGQVSEKLAHLDSVVAEMLRQSPQERPPTIAALKATMQRYSSEAVSLQRLSEFSGTVIKANEIDDPLAHEPPKLVGADWQPNGFLTLDRSVNPNWITAFQNMGSYSSVAGIGPHQFTFQADKARVSSPTHSVQAVINHFKEWLPRASQVLKQRLMEQAKREEMERRKQLEAARQAEEQRLRINRSIKI